MMTLFSNADILGWGGSIFISMIEEHLKSMYMLWKKTKNITHITFSYLSLDSGSHVKATVRDDDLPLVTSISSSWDLSGDLAAIHLSYWSNLRFLIEFAKEVQPKLDPIRTYIFTDAGESVVTLDLTCFQINLGIMQDSEFWSHSSPRSLARDVQKHSGTEDGPLVVITLGSTAIQLKPSSKSSLTIDDITLYPTPSLDYLSFVQGRNDIFIQLTVESHGHLIHDVELLDEDEVLGGGGFGVLADDFMKMMCRFRETKLL